MKFSVGKKPNVDHVPHPGSGVAFYNNLLTLRAHDNPGGVVGFELHLHVSWTEQIDVAFGLDQQYNDGAITTTSLTSGNWEIHHNFYDYVDNPEPTYGDANYAIAGFSWSLTPISGNGIIGYIPIQIDSAEGISTSSPSGIISFREFANDGDPTPPNAVIVGDDAGNMIPDASFTSSQIRVGRRKIGHQVRGGNIGKKGRIIGGRTLSLNSSQDVNFIENLKKKYKK